MSTETQIPSSHGVVLEANPRGIPKAVFFNNVEDVVDDKPEVTLAKFDETLRKYKFMDMNLVARMNGISVKEIEIIKSLEMIDLLIEKQNSNEALNVDFELYHTLYTPAVIPPAKTVCLWLGANVMLEYPIAEAKELLQEKKNTARATIEQIKEDRDYIREQITTMEVNIARVYNWDVQRRRNQS